MTQSPHTHSKIPKAALQQKRRQNLWLRNSCGPSLDGQLEQWQLTNWGSKTVIRDPNLLINHKSCVMKRTHKNEQTCNKLSKNGL